MKLSLEDDANLVRQWPVEYKVGAAFIALLNELDAMDSTATLYLLDEYGEIVEEVEGVNPDTLPLVLDNLVA